MIPLTALWLPILLSAVIVFFASFIMHMLLAYHKSDYRKLPDEDRVTDALRNAGVTRGASLSLSLFFVQGYEFGARGRQTETRTGGFVNCAAQRPAGNGKESGPMVFVLCGDQHLRCLPVRPITGARDRIPARIPHHWYRRVVRIRRSPDPGIDLVRPKLGGHVQASFR
jgi:hypothetical protein